MASLKQMGRDKLESLRREEGRKERERGKRAENQPVIEMASGKKELESTDRLGIGRWQRKRMKDGERTWRKKDVDVWSETEECRGWLYGPNKRK